MYMSSQRSINCVTPCVFVIALIYYNRWNEHCADSVLGQHLSLCPQECSIAEGFHLLHFSLEKSYVRVVTNTHTYMFINQT